MTKYQIKWAKTNYWKTEIEAKNRQDALNRFQNDWLALADETITHSEMIKNSITTKVVKEKKKTIKNEIKDWSLIWLIFLALIMWGAFGDKWWGILSYLICIIIFLLMIQGEEEKNE